MLTKKNPTDTQAWKDLKVHYKKIKNLHLRDLFKEDPHRAKIMSVDWNAFYLDYSKNRITRETLDLLTSLAKEMELKKAIESMFSGEPINETEERAVLHTALRNFSNDILSVGKENVSGEVKAVRAQMKEFSNKVYHGKWEGYSGKKITDVVNIGIGGSDLGPRMVAKALAPEAGKNVRVHFVSNIDGTEITQCLRELDPETTLFIIASKSFTTLETLTNAHTARKWFLRKAGDEKHIASNFVALSTNVEKVKEFGISGDNIFRFWDWVGGRFSTWSAIGLSVACYTGYETFERFLKGAEAMDLHFRQTPFRENIPVLLALISIWYNNFFKAETEAILPYDQNLARFPAYLQQLSMESNGKSYSRAGFPVRWETGNILWGEPGTNGQHSFYQLIHQGTKFIPCDFIAPINSSEPIGDHHRLLLSNFFAQPEALMNGKTRAMVKNEMKNSGFSADKIEKLLPFRIFEGNIPSNSLLIDKLTPEALGSLIAAYEHKVFVQGVIWNIFSFDQWGVELGKKLAGKIATELKEGKPVTSHDASTNNLINRYLNKNQGGPVRDVDK